MSASIYNHRNLQPTAPAGTAPTQEQLHRFIDSIKTEFDSILHENNSLKNQRDDFDVISGQVNELNIIRQALYDLEAQHSKIRQNYEDDLSKLRDELRAARAQVQTHPPGLAPSSAETIANRHPAIGAEPSAGPLGLVNRDRDDRERLREEKPALRIVPHSADGDRSGPVAPPERIMAPPEHRPESRAQRPEPRYGPSSDYRRDRDDRDRDRDRDARDSYSHRPTGSASSKYPTDMPPTPSVPQPQQSFPPAQQVTPPHPDEIDPSAWPAEYRKSGNDWTAFFNPNIPRTMDVALLFSFTHESVVCCVKFSADGRYLATGCNRAAHIYDMRTGERTHVLVDPSTGQNGDLYIRSVAWSPDGKYLATGAEDKIIRLWDIQKKRIRQVYEGHTQEIYSLDFSRDGNLIVSGSGDRTTRIWERDMNGCKILSIDEPENVDAGVTSVAISPDGRYVAAGSLDTYVRIWDVQTATLVERLVGHSDSVYSVSFTPDGTGLLSGSLDKTLKYWDVSQVGRKPKGSDNTAACIKDFRGHRDYVLSVAVSHDAQYIVSGSKDRGVQFWDARSAQVQLTLQGHKNSVISIDLSPTSSLLATGSGDAQARVWRYTRSGSAERQRVD